jgi:adenosine deaminase
VNSDDPPFFSTTLIDELRHAARLADLSRADLGDLQRRAALAAFAPADIRGRLVAAIDAWNGSTPSL